MRKHSLGPWLIFFAQKVAFAEFLSRILLRGLGVCLVLVTSTALSTEVKVTSASGKAPVSVIRRVELDYYLLTKVKPLEFRIVGPAWLRVYTRLWWPESCTGKATYALSLWQEEVQRPLVFETEISPSSYGPEGKKVGKWRSFYIQVPAGENQYRLTLDQAPAGTVGVRFSLEEPAEWQEVHLPGSPLTLVEEGRRIMFHELRRDVPLEVVVAGPCRVRVRVRLNYGPGLEGKQNFVLSVRENDSLLQTANFRTARSGAVYENKAEIVPAKEETMRFRLGRGEHRLELRLSGTLASSAAVRVERIADQKYE